MQRLDNQKVSRKIIFILYCLLSFDFFPSFKANIINQFCNLWKPSGSFLHESFLSKTSKRFDLKITRLRGSEMPTNRSWGFTSSENVRRSGWDGGEARDMGTRAITGGTGVLQITRGPKARLLSLLCRTTCFLSRRAFPSFSLPNSTPLISHCR